MPVALQRAGCKCHDDDWALEQVLVTKLVVVFQISVNPFLFKPIVGCFATAAAEDTDAVDPL